MISWPQPSEFGGFSTDGALSTGKYVTYEDDKQLFPPYYVTLLTRSSDFDGYANGKFADQLPDTPLGLYEPRNMPFGMKNAPAVFQREMQRVLRDKLYRGVMVFVDPESSEGAWLSMSLRQDITIVPDTRLDAIVPALRTFAEQPDESADISPLVRQCIQGLRSASHPSAGWTRA